MRVLVTGASGFLGGHVVPMLLGEGHRVSALTRSSAAAEKVARLGAEAVHGDLNVPSTVITAFAESGAEALVSLASLGFGHAPVVIAATEHARIKRAVFVSTTAIYTSLDSRSKDVRLAAEASVRASALDWTVLRPTMIYGSPADRNMARLLRLLPRMPVVPVPGGGRRLQQPVHVEDVAGAVVSALRRPQSIGRAYEIAGPEPLTFRQVVEQAAAAVGIRPRFISVPLGPLLACVRAYGAAVRAPPITSEQLQRLAEDKRFDISAAQRDLGYRPRSFEAGITEEVALL